MIAGNFLCIVFHTLYGMESGPGAEELEEAFKAEVTSSSEIAVTSAYFAGMISLCIGLGGKKWEISDDATCWASSASGNDGRRSSLEDVLILLAAHMSFGVALAR